MHPEKAVCVYPASHYPYWRSESSIELVSGTFGENLTVSELTEDSVYIGDVWRIGDARVEVSQPRQQAENCHAGGTSKTLRSVFSKRAARAGIGVCLRMATLNLKHRSRLLPVAS